jgi:fructose-1,6-bisphosphatase I
MNYDEIISALKQSSVHVSRFLRQYGGIDVINNIIINASGDKVHDVDILMNKIFVQYLRKCSSIKTLISEECRKPMKVCKTGKYIVAIDPLDGSSNIDLNINTGTIFGIYLADESEELSGKQLVTSGYFMYGPSTVLILAEETVSLYILKKDKYEMVKENIIIPKDGKIYSINEANLPYFEPSLQEEISNCKRESYTMRYVGSLIADIHRLLLKGGIFMYPTLYYPNKIVDKLRYTYEVAPIAYIISKAGGTSWIGSIPALEYNTENIHAQVGIVYRS